MGKISKWFPPFTGVLFTVFVVAITILIGQGYEESRPIPLTNGRGFVCCQCYESIRRQSARRAAERHEQQDMNVR